MDAEALLGEFRRTAAGAVARGRGDAADSTTLAGPEEVELATWLALLAMVARDYASAVAFLEHSLYAQLEKAVGKAVTAQDFEAFWSVHEATHLYAPPYVPRAFAYHVRRTPESFPDGHVSVVKTTTTAATAQDAPVVVKMLRRELPSTRPVTVKLGGDVDYVAAASRTAHVVVSHEFRRDDQHYAHDDDDFDGASTRTELALVARARQFSSFLVLLGSMTGKDAFEASHAVVLKDRDIVVAPLLLEALPTPKAFDDAARALSPAQRQFAQAVRDAQLASSVFALMVVQLAPQVEACLDLDAGALVKEVELSRDLMELFATYQIPTDLVAYDGPADAGRAVKVDAVKGHVSAVKALIDKARADDLHKAKERAQYRTAAEAPPREQQKVMTLDDDAAYEASVEWLSDEAEVSATFSSSRRRGAKRAAAAPQQARRTVLESTTTLHASVPETMGSGTAARTAPAEAAAPTRTSGRKTPTRAAAAEDDRHTPGGRDAAEDTDDVTQLPRRLDATYRRSDADARLRPTRIVPGPTWHRTSRASILADETTAPLRADELRRETATALDLVDALTRSGAIALKAAALHVVVAATHRFDKSVVDTVVVDDVDPIAKTENASLLIAATLHDAPLEELRRKDDIASHAAVGDGKTA
mmetsp:Transcript_26487/g.106015  ORF Transcript_26487/g.106015 Transcript_26487/m.106015 type:complete len:647 (+) Transcript_26487:1406-3346(+)